MRFSYWFYTIIYHASYCFVIFLLTTVLFQQTVCFDCRCGVKHIWMIVDKTFIAFEGAKVEDLEVKTTQMSYTSFWIQVSYIYMYTIIQTLYIVNIRFRQTYIVKKKTRVITHTEKIWEGIFLPLPHYEMLPASETKVFASWWRFFNFFGNDGFSLDDSKTSWGCSWIDKAPWRIVFFGEIPSRKRGLRSLSGKWQVPSRNWFKYGSYNGHVLWWFTSWTSCCCCCCCCCCFP